MHKANGYPDTGVKALHRHCVKKSVPRKATKPVSALLYTLLFMLSVHSEQSAAFFGVGVDLNEQCAAQGRTPTEPFEINLLDGKNGCKLCHRNGIFGEGKGRTAYEENDLDFFCKVDKKNNPPVLDSIGAQKASMGSLLRFNVVASDPDGDTIALSAEGIPRDANFVDNRNGTGVFSWVPSAAADEDDDDSESGQTRRVTFVATDSGKPVRSASQNVTIILEAAPKPVNQPPVLAAIGNKNGLAETELTFSVTASDPDGDTVTVTASGLPTGATFSQTGNGRGVFSWVPAVNQAGNRTVTFSAIDTGNPVGSDSERINIGISTPNRPPVLSPIGPKSVTALERLEFTVSASDADNDNVFFNVGNLPTGAVVTSNGDGTAVFSWVPQQSQVGSHRVNFSVTDDGSPTASDAEEVTIVVGAVNRPPVLTPIGNQTVEVTQTLNLTISASDPDGNAIAFTAGDLPADATFTPNGNGLAAFSWTPRVNDIGSHTLTFVATDDGAPVESDSESVVVTVTALAQQSNQPPALNAIGNQQVIVGEELSFTITATDPDGDPLKLTTENLPSGAAFIDLGDRSAEFSWLPGEEDFGSHAVTVIATDEGNPPAEVRETFTIAVDKALEQANRPPVLGEVANQTVFVGDTVRVPMKATDPDGDSLQYRVFSQPRTSTLVDNGDGTAVLNWAPTVNDIGRHVFLVLIIDSGNPAEIDGQVVFLEVKRPVSGNLPRPWPSAGQYDFVFPDRLRGYKVGTRVLQPDDGHIYECRPFPYSSFCGQWREGASQFEPGVGSSYGMAWKRVR